MTRLSLTTLFGAVAIAVAVSAPLPAKAAGAEAILKEVEQLPERHPIRLTARAQHQRVLLAGMTVMACEAVAEPAADAIRAEAATARRDFAAARVALAEELARHDQQNAAIEWLGHEVAREAALWDRFEARLVGLLEMEGTDDARAAAFFELLEVEAELSRDLDIIYNGVDGLMLPIGTVDLGKMIQVGMAFENESRRIVAARAACIEAVRERIEAAPSDLASTPARLG
ncbi:MAG: hypothetical protein AAF074_22990 [Pseudomonadota bacterium]